MKICFVWVEKFRNFENFGINLSSDTKFKFDHINNQIINEEITPLPYNFFGERITDVIGIIGKNGVGKSNVVEMICKSLKGGKSSLNCDFFIIIKEENIFKCYYNFKDKSKNISASFNIEFQEYTNSIKSLNVVFFSNVFDEKRLNFDKEIADISVNNLHYKKPNFRGNFITDFEKQLDFINSKLFTLLGTELPSSIQIISRVFLPIFNSSQAKANYGESYENIKKFIELFRRRIREIKEENRFIYLLRFGFFFEVFNSYAKSKGFRLEFKEIDFFFKSLQEKNLGTDEISEKLLDYIEYKVYRIENEQLEFIVDYDYINQSESQKDRIINQISFLRNIKQLVNQVKISYDYEGRKNSGFEYYTIDYNENSNDFIRDLVKNFGKSRMIEIKWLGISSGHKAYLNLFASINHELKNKRNNNLLLCIDEGDLYLHPKWQIEFFDRLVNTLPQIYLGNIQLILTSHSPFLLSDLPNQNLVILDKSQEGGILNGIALKNKTFSGNLYDLYREPFFLENQVTSEFAYKKLIEIIKDVENKNYKNKSEIINKVDLIGDDIIRHRLEKILRDD